MSPVYLHEHDMECDWMFTEVLTLSTYLGLKVYTFKPQFIIPLPQLNGFSCTLKY